MTGNKWRSNQAAGDLPDMAIPADYNYIGVFLTFACNLRCSYCINRFGGLSASGSMLTGEEWRRGLNRLVSRTDLPVTLQGGEPSLHPDFLEIIRGIRPELNIDVLTNLELDIDRFMGEVPPDRIRRDAPYASIRVSYHPEVMEIEPLASKVLTMLEKGYSIGIWGVEHPAHGDAIARARDYCANLGIDFRTKEFLGEYAGILYGDYTYPGACERRFEKTVRCRPSELLIGPDGNVFRCHGDLYEGRQPVGHILDPGFSPCTGFRPCRHYGHCNPCDVKTKTNRFQQFGHTSVEIEL